MAVGGMYGVLTISLLGSLVQGYADGHGKVVSESSIISQVQNEKDNLLMCTTRNYNSEDAVHVLHGDDSSQLSEAVNMLIDEDTDIVCSTDYCILSSMKAVLCGKLNKDGNIVVNDGVSYKSTETGESISIPIIRGNYTLYMYKGDWDEFTFDGYEEYSGSLVTTPFTWVVQGVKDNTLVGVDTDKVDQVGYFSIESDELGDGVLKEDHVEFTENFSFVVVNSNNGDIVSVGHKK